MLKHLPRPIRGSFNGMELERLMKAPFNRLQREELRARKLLRRFHDNQEPDKDGEVTHDETVKATAM